MISGYIGIPFVDRGRTLAGCDCWGLVRIVHFAEASIELESYGDISAKELIAIAREIKGAIKGEPWVDVGDQPRREMDVVVMRKLEMADKVPYHVGIMVSPTRLLHTVYAANSHTVPINDPSVKSRIIAYRRHRDLV